MLFRVFLAAATLLSSGAWAMALSDNLLSPSFFASQGALVNPRFRDALSWTQNPATLTEPASPHLSSGLFLVYPHLDPKPAAQAARGAAVIGLVTPILSGGLGVALSMPLGQNVWVDTGPRETSSLFGLARISAFSLALGWGREWGDGWSAGLHIPILFRSNTMTDIYLLEENAWARARAGVMPYFGWHLGLQKSWSEKSHLALSYREEQASKIEFSVKGEVDFANITLPLEASGFSEILFEPRRLDLRYQQQISDWLVGVYTRWSHWRSAPKLGLVIDSKVPQTSTEASFVRWQNQIEVVTSIARDLGFWTPVLSYRFRSKAIADSDDYFDYDEHIVAAGAHVEILHDELWLTAATRLHKLVGGGDLISVLAAVDWTL
ncbi:MAG TPA: hypothetical protein VM901_03865 [Bdellovibrionota bacterium]|jgi:hypothetical protein|nr:hypothetical protein [Bdellovibrionota bacterium]